MTADPGRIVVLNGAPRSGKSSIAAAIQRSFDGAWMNLGVDAFMSATPERLRPGLGLRPGGERPDLEALLPALYAGLYGSIAAHSRLGVDLGVQSSDVFVADAIALAPGRAVEAVRTMREPYVRPEMTARHLLTRMEGRGLIETADALRPHCASL